MATPEVSLRSSPRVDPHTGAVTVMLRVSPLPSNGRVSYVAPPPAERRSSPAGSGLPLASAEQALESARASRGVANVDIDGTFAARLDGMPTAYYDRSGTVLVPPCVHVTYVDAEGRRARGVAILGVPPVPHRSLSHPASRAVEGPAFYRARRDDVRSQAGILRDSAWRPDAGDWLSGSAAFWGDRPPL